MFEKKNNEYLLFWKRCNGASGYKPGVLVTNEQKVIEKTQWEKFNTLLNGINFCNAIAKQKNVGVDGASWILEGKVQNQYCFMDKWSPNSKDKYYKCCNFLIELTGLNIKKKDKY